MEAWLKQLHAGYARICEGVAGNKGAADEESAQPPVRPKTATARVKTAVNHRICVNGFFAEKTLVESAKSPFSSPGAHETR